MTRFVKVFELNKINLQTDSLYYTDSFMSEDIFFPVSFFALGCFSAGFIFFLFHISKIGSYKKLAAEILNKAEKDIDKYKAKEIKKIKDEKNKDLEERKKDFCEKNEKIQHAREAIERQKKDLEKKLRTNKEEKKELENLSQNLRAKERSLKELNQKIEKKENDLLDEIEKTLDTSREEQKKIYIKKVEKEARLEASLVIRKIQKKCKQQAEQITKDLIYKSLQRVDIPTSCDSSSVKLKDKSQKSRIIGKEGRNIKAFEAKSGTRLIIDDGQEVFINSSHPIKRELAKIALEKLLNEEKIDARIIADSIKNAAKEFEQALVQKGKMAAEGLLIMNLNPEIARLLGKLSLYSYQDQNLLQKSQVLAQTMGSLALELGLNADLSKRIGLLHLIGLASNELDLGSYPITGHSIALKYGESVFVANGIGSQDKKMPPLTMEATLCPLSTELFLQNSANTRKKIESIKNLESLLEEEESIKNAYAIELEDCIYVLLMTPDSEIENSNLFLQELSQKMLTKTKSKKIIELYLSHAKGLVYQIY